MGIDFLQYLEFALELLNVHLANELHFEVLRHTGRSQRKWDRRLDARARVVRRLVHSHLRAMYQNSVTCNPPYLGLVNKSIKTLLC